MGWASFFVMRRLLMRNYCSTGIPAALVACWAPVIEFVWLREQMLSRNGSFGTTNKCWYPNAESSYYFILEVPRFFVIAINLIFLINIIRVLLTKLRDSHQSDTVQIRYGSFTEIFETYEESVGGKLRFCPLLQPGMTQTKVYFAKWYPTGSFVFKGFCNIWKTDLTYSECCCFRRELSNLTRIFDCTDEL